MGMVTITVVPLGLLLRNRISPPSGRNLSRASMMPSEDGLFACSPVIPRPLLDTLTMQLPSSRSKITRTRPRTPEGRYYEPATSGSLRVNKSDQSRLKLRSAR